MPRKTHKAAKQRRRRFIGKIDTRPKRRPAKPLPLEAFPPEARGEVKRLLQQEAMVQRAQESGDKATMQRLALELAAEAAGQSVAQYSVSASLARLGAVRRPAHGH